ncbi:Gfo/Idh/MocA family oxidoreductase [Bosea sp. 117]|uniref:Gfo/Idh/MocA family protein n=1 Tax=Bosea sp. 117 TaxID=1125973 RepID=UPI000494484A|nr:Gfo/Idh/MocA family oxidoreductase [Bosea sp. 117]
MRQVDVAVIGTGWCGGIRAETLARSPLVKRLHIAETNDERRAHVARLTGATTATADYRELLADPAIEAVYVCATPESTHYPITLAALEAGKHVFLEKPIAIELTEADELIRVAARKGRKFTIGYSQRFNPKFAYAKKKLVDGTLGAPVSALVSRHITRGLGKKITGRGKLSPAAMEATHDLDFVFWLLEPAKPVRVYAQGVRRVMYPTTGAYDCQFITVTMDNGCVVVVGAGWILPPGYPNFSSTWIEVVGSEGALVIDDTHRDVWLNTMGGGSVFPMSTMPGEQVDHVYAGAMGPETLHFLEAVVFDRDVMVTLAAARTVMEVYIAADLSSETNEPVDLPFSNADAVRIAEGAL